jgi:hypothetical protein
LRPVRPEGFVMVNADNSSTHSDGLPWWLYDMRPQGYIGRAYAKAHAAQLDLPENPERWNDTQTVRALLADGHDAIGNLLLGELAMKRFVDAMPPVKMVINRELDYPALAVSAAIGETPGSSAGGEQPKFTAYTAQGHRIVKFTTADNNSITERWRDLLLAEHLALAVLGVDTTIVDAGGQRFLEVPRFDRVGRLGRVGVFSLRALDAEFVGAGNAPWPEVVSRLAAAGQTQRAAVPAVALLWAYGALIGNTDMHLGNLSFTSSGRPPYQLAPTYDMLPMGFAPSSNGAITNTLAPANLIAAINGDTWRLALAKANAFLTRVQTCADFSENFVPCIAALEQHLINATDRIGRIG